MLMRVIKSLNSLYVTGMLSIDAIPNKITHQMFPYWTMAGNNKVMVVLKIDTLVYYVKHITIY